MSEKGMREERRDGVEKEGGRRKREKKKGAETDQPLGLSSLPTGGL